MAQKAEIGMLLYEEVEKQVEEERREKQAETLKERHEKGELESLGIGKGSRVLIKKKNNTPVEYKKEDTTAYKVAQKVKVKLDQKSKKTRVSFSKSKISKTQKKDIPEKKDFYFEIKILNFIRFRVQNPEPEFNHKKDIILVLKFNDIIDFLYVL